VTLYFVSLVSGGTVGVLREGRASPQEVPPRKCPEGAAMAAPWRWLQGLQVTLRLVPMHRPLHDATPSRDVLLFEHKRGRFFTVLGLFCAGQGVFWMSLAVAALSPPQVPAQLQDAQTPKRSYFDLRATLWRYGLAVGCGAIGKAWSGFPMEWNGMEWNGVEW
jgi:hypothetical protein